MDAGRPGKRVRGKRISKVSTLQFLHGWPHRVLFSPMNRLPRVGRQLGPAAIIAIATFLAYLPALRGNLSGMTATMSLHPHSVHGRVWCVYGQNSGLRSNTTPSCIAPFGCSTTCLQTALWDTALSGGRSTSCRPCFWWLSSDGCFPLGLHAVGGGSQAEVLRRACGLDCRSPICASPGARRVGGHPIGRARIVQSKKIHLLAS